MYTYTHTYTYIYIYIFIHTYTYIYIYAYKYIDLHLDSMFRSEWSIHNKQGGLNSCTVLVLHLCNTQQHSVFMQDTATPQTRPQGDAPLILMMVPSLDQIWCWGGAIIWSDDDQIWSDDVTIRPNEHIIAGLICGKWRARSGRRTSFAAP